MIVCGIMWIVHLFIFEQERKEMNNTLFVVLSILENLILLILFFMIFGDKLKKRKRFGVCSNCGKARGEEKTNFCIYCGIRL